MARIQCKISRSGRKRWYVTIRMKGCPTISAVFDTKTHAKEFEAKTESEIRQGRYLPQPSSGRYTLADLIDRYAREILPSKAKSTQESDRGRLVWWRENLGHVVMKYLTPEIIQETLPKIAASGRGNGPTSIRRHVAVLSAALQTAREWRWINTNPAREVRLPKEPKGRLRYLTKEEYARLLKAVNQSRNPMLAPAVYLSLCTGVRRGELLSLTWDQVYLERGHITLLNTKNKTDRGVPLTKEAIQVLREFKKIRRIDTNLVFPGASGKKGIYLNRPWHEALQAAKIKDFKWHDMRHTCASYLAMSGAALLTIAEILGHKTLQQTKRYAHLSADHVRGDLEKMSGAFLAGR